MYPFQTKFHDFWTNKNPQIHISELPDFRKIGPYSSGDHFSESCAPRKMMQNRIDEIFWGQTFKNTSYFTLGTSGSWTWDLGTKILLPRSWYQKNVSKKEQKTNPREVLIKKEQSKIHRSLSVPEPNLRDSSESDKSKLVSLEEENVIMNRSKYF